MNKNISKNKRLLFSVIFIVICNLLSLGASYPSSSYVSKSGGSAAPIVQPLLGDTGMTQPGDPGSVPVGDDLLPLSSALFLYLLYRKLRNR